MSFINYSSREINCKIVYYGPGLCGKTTNLQYVYNKTNPEAKGKMISLATETERTLFFDFLPLSLGKIRGFKTRFHLYTVPGQVFYDASRKQIYVSCGAGFIDVIAQRNADEYDLRERVPTVNGARTSFFSPERDELYLAVRAGLFSGSAEIRAFKIEP